MNARLMMCVMVQFALLTCGTSLMAQDESAEQPPTLPGGGRFVSRGAPPKTAVEPARTVQSIQLQSADARTVAKVLSELYDYLQIVPVPHVNSILISCSEEEGAAIRKIVEKLDVDVVLPTYEKSAVEILPVKHRSVNELLDRLFKLTGHIRVSLSADGTRSSIVAIAEAEEGIREVESYMKLLDTPLRSVSLEFTVFLADLNPSEERHPIPSDLEEVAKELARFGRLKLIGRYHTNATEGRPYQMTGELHEGVEATFVGNIERVGDDRLVRASVSAKVAVLNVHRGEGPIVSRRGSFQIETTFALPPDEYVALGASAAGLTEGQSLILVARARP